ncbi:MAG: metal-dependent hydrolase [Qipengyuania sp.]|nr:metal-dependent hydrolase [Qipengyuania sp.]
MDNLTHSLVGALIGQAGLKRKTGLAMPALIVGANLPDVDAASFLWLDGVEHLAFRRGITHGPVAWVLLPLLLAGALWWFDRWQTRRGSRPEKRLPVRFGWLYGLAFLATLTHPALDWLNVYGIRLLEPFSSRWFYGDVLFIIDVWLWAVLGAGVWLSLRRESKERDWRTPARTALAIALPYIVGNGVWSGLIRFAEGASFEKAISSPLPLAFWDRELIGFVSEGQYEIDGRRFGNCDLARSVAQAGYDTGLVAFLFWSRAPFAERAPDGSVLIRDARYYDPRARARFTVALPDVRCEPLSKP